MSSSEYWVNICQHGTRLGAGFFIMPRYVLTARHCLGEIQEDDTVELYCADGEPVDGRLYRRLIDADLALIETIKPRDAPLDLPRARPPSPREHWTNPYRPTNSEPFLHGIIAHPAVGFLCADGASVEALQLSCEQRLGSYAGYSGSPIEREDAEGTVLLGILLEQYPDRESPERATDVLFAATIKDALSRFDCFSVSHLLDVLDPPSLPIGSAVPAPAPASGPGGYVDTGAANEPSTGKRQLSLGDASALVDKFEEWVDRGLLDLGSLQELTLRIAKSVVEASISEMTR